CWMNGMHGWDVFSAPATGAARRSSAGPGLERRMESRHSDAYIELREPDDAVVTCLLTKQSDPQRGKPTHADPALLRPWRTSIKDKATRAVVLHTSLREDSLTDTELVQVSQHVNVYFERWIQYYRWLRAHPEVGRVWFTDGTDVEMLRDPFPEMESGKL